MKSLLIGILLLLAGCDRSKSTAAPAAATQPAQLAHLTVRVIDLRNQKGQLLFGVYKSAEGFPSTPAQAVNWQIRPAGSKDLVFVADLPPGDYSASVLHDENSDGKMNTNIIGIPIEGYGVTNNPKPRRRAAKFAEGLFALPPGGASLTISIQYDYY